MAKHVCDFCLSEGGRFFNRPKRIPDGHHICKKCRATIESYGLPIQFDIFQQLVTAQENLRDMIMDAYLESHDANLAIDKFFPLPEIRLHDGEHCINAIPATITVERSDIPDYPAIRHVSDIQRKDINNIPDVSMDRKKNGMIVRGMLYESEVALYFMSEKFINCHRLGFIRHDLDDKTKIVVQTKKNTFTYTIQRADMFFMRERFFRKVNAAANNKHQHLIYIRNDNEMTITPGVYEIPRSLRPGVYKVKAVKDKGLHVRDSIGRVKDYYDTDECIDLSDGGILECTGEYELQWVGEKKDKTTK